MTDLAAQLLAALDRAEETARAATDLRVRIPSCPGYSVTPMGVVWSEDSNWRGYGPRPMVPAIHDGYARVDLKVGGREVHRFVHALVAEVFLGPRPEGSQVCHRDGNRLHNWWPNLRYGTAAQNAADRNRHATTAHGERNGFAKFSESEVAQVRDGYESGSTVTELANEYGMSQRNVGHIVRGERRVGLAAPGPMSQDENDAAHIAANDPDHVLRLCAALREVVKLHYGVDFGALEGIGHVDLCHECRDERWPCPTLVALASVWDVPGVAE